MSGRIENDSSVYTVDELAQVLGVTESEVATILEEHGYRLTPEDMPLVKLTEEDYRDLMEEPPLDVDPH
jgi:hypothetical protein